MRASVVTTLLSLVVASLPGAVRAASTERRVQIEGYPHLAAVPSRARVLVDDNGNTTSYAYDARDRGTYVVGADLTVQRTVFDADSNVVETIDRNGTTIAYTHDGDHRVVKAEVTRRATGHEPRRHGPGGRGHGGHGLGVRRAQPAEEPHLLGLRRRGSGHALGQKLGEGELERVGDLHERAQGRRPLPGLGAHQAALGRPREPGQGGPGRSLLSQAADALTNHDREARI